MGVVYRARQIHLDRLVALKVLPADAARDPSFTERFTREARALAKINHPGIVGIHDFGKAGPFHYLVMEYVDGVDLRRMLEARRIESGQALGLVMQICEALQFAHDRGVVHRDIKPGNILVDRSGRVKIADFGLAKLLDGHAPEVALTASHHVMGTPNYMAPEQMTSPLAVDHRADIYSLGVVFYEMLTGNLPVGRFPPPSQKIQVDVRLDEVVLRTLEQEPDRRYQHARDVRSDVESLGPARPGPQPAPASPPPSPPPLPLADRLRKWWTGRPASVDRWIHGLLLLAYALGLIALFSFHFSFDNQATRRQVGFPSPWLRWESRFLGGTSGFHFSLHFPLATWLLAALGLVAFELRLRLLRTRRPLRWTDTLPHYAVWLVLFVSVSAFVLGPQFPSRTAVIRELPPRQGHVANGLRTAAYAVEAPVNHRLNTWIECWKDGRRVEIPGFAPSKSITPARGGRFKGYAELLMATEARTRGGRTNVVDWQWSLRGDHANAADHDLADDPFLGLPYTDSSFGRKSVHKLRAGEELSLLIVRGSREPLPTQPADPRLPGQADFEMHLKVRIDPLLESHLGESYRVGPAEILSPTPPSP
jgi:serine/threonine protein kinase